MLLISACEHLCVRSLPLLHVFHWRILIAFRASSGFVLESFPSVCLSVHLLPCILSLSLSGSSLHQEQISRWFTAGIHFLCHSYFYRTVITLNHSPLSLKTYSTLRPTACLRKFPVQTRCHISCEKRVFRLRDLHELNNWMGEQANCFVYTYFPWHTVFTTSRKPVKIHSNKMGSILSLILSALLSCLFHVSG